MVADDYIFELALDNAQYANAVTTAGYARAPEPSPASCWATAGR